MIGLLILLLCACQSTKPKAPTQQDVAAISQSLLLTQTTKENLKSNSESTEIAPVKVLPEVAKKPKITDLWLRISTKLSFANDPNERLKKRLNWYLSQPNYLVSVSKRASPYLYHIVEEIERRNLPMELVLLPFVESDFRPEAVSSEHAVGAWQLVNATAYHFGITTDRWYDGRKDVLASTHAALEYLSYLHKRFNGNWLHALAAYNSGEGRVKKAIARNKRRGKSTNFWHLSLPKETAEYVPKLMALSYLLQTEHPNFKRPKLPNYALTSPLDIGQQFDFSILASISGVRKAALHKLNPGYLLHESSPNGPHKILLPFSEQSLIKSDFFQRYFSQTYTVRSNDTLYRLAQRFNTSISNIKLLNNKQSDMIRIGEVLKVKQTQKFGNLLVDYKISPYVAKVQQPKPLTMEFHHTINDGDSLWKISKHYKVSVKDLLVWNELNANKVLKPGKVLILHLPKANETPKKPNKSVFLSDLEQLVKPETRSNR
ncbi:Membrane-bound lytic murein transglycosylase D [Pseudoalteromonas sp. CIP111854]|uniref:Membrane-bound lytic murein transglycosylase D n=1 Tax=Pseudoalteromonas holothuriae TaxID=2963714 RepID=A0A9W4W2H9_9GAMM|nr:LysM peptidoglycan-binding domain-containing protein [Pseudoalteromonas sp. CIP111854]CAH9054290.1 Membrane-bound lytic murein transglycosylase D [Pseudoalteromonas sp. CIP111854]